MTAHSGTPAPFSDRLALARRIVARGLSAPSPHLADQLDAAGADTRAAHDRVAAVLPMIEPERNWRHRIDAYPSDTVRAYLLATVLGCTTVCIHLRRGGPQPSFARLPLRRVDCERCSQTIVRAATADDECDVCGRHETLIFFPFTVNRGPILIAGDACGGCAEVLGIRAVEAAS